MSGPGDLDSLIRDLADLQKEVKVEELLEEALAEPQPTGERFRQMEQVLEVFKGLGLFGGTDPRDLHLLMTLGQTYERFLNLEKAHETYQTALELAQKLGDGETYAMLLCRMGRVLSRWDRWEEAEDVLTRSREAYRERKDELGQARVR